MLLNYSGQEKVVCISAQCSDLKAKDTSNIVADGFDENLCGDEP